MSDFKALKEKFGDYCLFDEPASGFTTYRAGGKAEALVKPGTPEELLWLAGWCRENGAPLMVLGRGSNVLVSDKGLPGVTALTERLAGIKLEDKVITAQAGVLWDDLAMLSAGSGLAGFEKASGIPGSVGGAVRMNAGAFGQETFDRLVSIDAFDRAGLPVKLPSHTHAERRELMAGVAAHAREHNEAMPDVRSSQATGTNHRARSAP